MPPTDTDTFSGTTQQRHGVKSLPSNIVEDDLPARFQLRPSFAERFRPQEVSQIVQSVLQERLSGLEYNQEQCTSLTKDISTIIRDRIARRKGYDRYKIITTVCIGEQRGEGVKLGCRCFWDEDTDNYASETFVNSSLFCNVTVFGVYTP